MVPSSADNPVARFALTLVDAGSMLGRLVSDLAEGLPEDAYPGEDPTAVVVEMMCGTIATALEGADPQDVKRTTELIELARERVLEHLQLAAKLSARIHGGDGRTGRAYG
jgi:hypothetical protein